MRSCSLAVLVLPLALACGAADDRTDVAGTPKPPAELRSAVDRTTAPTGDLITYEVEVEREPDVSVDLADPGTGIAGFRIVDLGQDSPETLAALRRVGRAMAAAEAGPSAGGTFSEE